MADTTRALQNIDVGTSAESTDNVLLVEETSQKLVSMNTVVNNAADGIEISSLETDDKTLSGAINALNSNVDNLVGTVLYENLTGTYPGFSSGSVTLSDSMQNYKKLRFDAYSSTWGIRPFTVEVDISVLENFEVLTLTETVFSTTPNVYACSMILSFTDTTFTVTSNKRCLIGDASVSDIAQLYVYRITGLK